MGTFVDTKIISLTSQSANIKLNDTYLSNVRYTNNYGLIGKSETNVVHKQIQLLHAQIPYSFYVINYSNNILSIKLGTGSVQTLTISPGNYNGSTLMTAIKTLVNDANFAISLSSINGKLTFAYNTTFTIYNNTKYTIGSILGFSSSSTNTSSSNSLTAPFPLNLLGIKTLQIKSLTLVTNNYSSVEGGQTTLISSIPVNSVPFGMVDFKDTGNNLITIYNDTLDDLDIEIIDGETGNYINFNGQDWCLTFALHLTKMISPPFPLIDTIKETNHEEKTIGRNDNGNLADLNLLLSKP